MTLKWLRDNWFLFTFVFATGSATAYGEMDRRAISKALTEQQAIVQEQQTIKTDIAVLKEQNISSEKTRQEIKDLLNSLVKIQMERRGQ